ncbi:D-cysteine desulfhydrase family protein [Pseudomonas sp. NPDC090202]|uniref:D-cysteine desulfhydrase family protein n=1 Tax=unclassified Pseudomonas TaxID=196821 RepID=UPI003809C223
MHSSLDQALQFIPRLPLLDGPTPIQRATRLEQALRQYAKGVGIYLKRDDHMSIGGGGNKLRKLEYLLGRSVEERIDTVITVGGVQSNHARLTAATCARLGLDCELILTRAVPKSDTDYALNGNVLLDQLFGARMEIHPAGTDSVALAQARAAQLAAAGRKAVVIPTGGSTPLGALGYARCAAEIADQEPQFGVTFNQVIVPNGSAGTHAGLAAGFALLGRDPAQVRSFAVLADQATAIDKTRQLLDATLALLGADASTAAPNIDGRQLGSGYGLPTQEMLDAVRLMARSEGLLLDPVYSGKAFAGLLNDLREGRYQPGDNVLFIMTGGAPGLYAYRETFQG